MSFFSSNGEINIAPYNGVPGNDPATIHLATTTTGDANIYINSATEGNGTVNIKASSSSVSGKTGTVNIVAGNASNETGRGVVNVTAGGSSGTINLTATSGTEGTINLNAHTLQIGTSVTTTIDVGENLNTSKVNISGITMPYFKNTYASFASDASSSTQSHFYLPISDQNFILVQLGFAQGPSSNTDTTVTFGIPFTTNTTPYVFVTRYGAGGGPATIQSLTNSTCIIDSSSGSSTKQSIFWVAIGLKSITNVT